MFYINLKIALRNLQRNKGFSLINIGGLAIGLTCCLMLLLYVNYEWSYDTQFKDLSRIYITRLNHEIDGGISTYDATPNRVAGAALQTLPGIEAASRVVTTQSDKLLSYQNNKFKVRTINVDPSFLKIFDYKVAYGNMLSALNDPHSIILTEKIAAKLFGDKVNPVGLSLKWDDRKILKVTAVIKDLPNNQSLQFEGLQTWAFYEEEHPNEKQNGWGAISCLTIMKLKDHGSFAETDASLRKMIRANDSYAHLEAFLFPFKKYHLYNEFENGKLIGGRINQVKLFAFLAFCVLLIASINYMNLSTARSEKRAREVGVRKALGSTRKLLMGQFVMESLLFSFLAMMISFALLEVTLPYFNQLLNISIAINYSSYPFWATLFALILITGLLAGSYPAFYLSSFTPIKVLKGFNGLGTSSSLSIRKVLVIVQFSLSIGMIICAIIIYTQMQFIKNKPLGFDQNNLVQLQIDGDLKNPFKMNLLKEQLKRTGAIVSVTEFSGSLNNRYSNTSDISWAGKDVKDEALFEFRSVGLDFAKTVGSMIVAGRDFSQQFKSDTVSSVILNQAAVQRMGLKNPVGTLITWYGYPEQLKIIGVIADYSNNGLGAKSLPTVYYSNLYQTNVLLLRLNSAQPVSRSIASIKQVYERLNSAFPPDLIFIDQTMADKLENERLLSILSNLFGGFCIFISCLGLLGLALFTAEQRKREISIRKVLGADLKSILILLNKDFLKLVLVSNIIAFPLAYVFASNWLRKYDFRIDIGISPFLIAALMSLLIAVLTVSLQTFKVAKANAVDSLKYE